MNPMEFAMDRMHREFEKQAGIILGGTTSTCNVAEADAPLTIEKLLEAIESLPPPPPDSPIPTRFDYAPHMPRDMGLIISNDTKMPVGTIRWAGEDNVEIAVLRNAKNTYAQCGLDVYEVIMRKLAEDGPDGLSPLSAYKRVDISP